jgi:large subunit ribosomal protein L19
MSSRIRQADQPYERHDLPEIKVGDSVDVQVKVTEGDRERVQTFSGVVIRVRGGGLGRTFTVRRIVQGEGVERTFPMHSPVIAGIEVTRKGRVRRSRLYYLRDRVGKSTRLREVLGQRGNIQGKRKAPKADAEVDVDEAPDPENAPATVDVEA